MSSLVYLVLTQMKNSLKELIHKPGKLILYLVLVLLVVGGMAMSIFGGSVAQGDLSADWLLGIYFAFVTLFLVLSVQKGLTSGDAIFEMSDVNLLFVSPINPRSILLYGLVRLAKTSFWAGFFILFQSSSLANFGINFGGILILFFVFMLTMMVLTILSLVIYGATNGSARKKRVVKVLTVAAFSPAVVWLAVQFVMQGDAMAALQSTLASPAVGAVPIAGWAAAGALALIKGQVLVGMFWLGLVVVAGGGMLAYILLSRADYYEDVLVATETAFERKRATEEGDIQAVNATTAKVKVTKTGIGGEGASAFFYKHLRETFRQNRLGFFSVYTIIMFLSCLGVAILLRGELDTVFLLQIIMWMQIFMIGNGRGLRELYTHYIYMVPESPLKKVIWSNLELVFKTLVESVLFLGIPGLIMGDNILVVLLAMVVYTLFAFLLLGINYLSMRWTGATLSQGLLIMIYALAVIIAMAPGLVAALVVGFSIGGAFGLGVGLLILAVWELAAALLSFVLSKNVLHNCDMPSAKPSGK